MNDLWHALTHALSITGAMTWEITWALILGFTLSAVVQAVVRKSTIVRLLGDHVIALHRRVVLAEAALDDEDRDERGDDVGQLDRRSGRCHESSMVSDQRR